MFSNLNRRIIYFCLLQLFTKIVAINGDIEKEDGVYVLNEKNFDEFLRLHPILMVEFYAPWCGHCKLLAPEYAKAASKLSIPLAKVDATVEVGLAKRYNVEGFPTLKFWANSGEPIHYDGGREAEDIVQWVSAKIDPDYKPPPEEVISLTKETFDDFIESHSLVLVEFYAPWCGHCKSLAPELEKAAKKLKEKNIMLAKVDATVEKSLATEYGVTGFPTLKILRNGRRSDYNGPRDTQGIINYMIKQSEPAVKMLRTVKEVEQFMQKMDVTVVGFFNSEDSLLLKALSDVAERTREDFKIGFCLVKEVMTHFNVKPNSVVGFYPEIFWSKYESKKVVYDKESGSTEELLEFLRENSAPLVGQMTRKNAATRYTKLPLVVVYYNVDFSLEYRDGTQYWRKKVVEEASRYMGKYRFAIADEDEFSKELMEVGLGDSGLEHNVVVFGYDGKKYPMDPVKYDGDFDENFSRFMKDLSSGRVKAYIKSAPVPKVDKGAVKTVVGSNFAQIVFDESKDVLIEFYAPWCAHCKAFEPEYKKLASNFVSKEPNLLFVKVDATINDIPKGYEVSGFPTIYFAPSGKKNEPIKYDGNRDISDLTRFIEKYAVMSFKRKTEL